MTYGPAVSAAVDITRNYCRDDILLAAAIVQEQVCECCESREAQVPASFPDGELFLVCRPCATLVAA